MRYTKKGRSQTYKELYGPSKKNFICKYCDHKFNFDTKYKKQLCWKCNRYNFRTAKDEFHYRMRECLARKREIKNGCM